jgi:5-formyltetrahydrofolate cyclo-ligase
MRRIRRGVTDQAERSARIWSTVTALDAVARASTVMVYRSIPGEPDTAPFIEWCRARGVLVVVPEDGPDPRTLDVVIVPGLAFAPDGHRLGQGGGWYDRFLTGVGEHCETIGVGFSEQVLDRLPVEAHDVVLDRVVSDTDIVR